MVKYFAALDVGAENTAICVVDQAGDLVMETTQPTEPKAISKSLALHRRRLAVVGQETGGFSVWLHRELLRSKLPMTCLDARTTRAALKAQRNKTDRNDARDIAVLLSRGFKHGVHIKSDEAHAMRLLLTCRRTFTPPMWARRNATLHSAVTGAVATERASGVGLTCERLLLHLCTDWVPVRCEMSSILSETFNFC